MFALKLSQQQPSCFILEVCGKKGYAVTHHFLCCFADRARISRRLRRRTRTPVWIPTFSQRANEVHLSRSVGLTLKFDNPEFITARLPLSWLWAVQASLHFAKAGHRRSYVTVLRSCWCAADDNVSKKKQHFIINITVNFSSVHILRQAFCKLKTNFNFVWNKWISA
jgi:hypothetical protein